MLNTTVYIFQGFYIQLAHFLSCLLFPLIFFICLGALPACVSVHVGPTSAHGGQRRGLDPETGVPVSCEHHVSVVGIKPGSSGRASSVLNQ